MGKEVRQIVITGATRGLGRALVEEFHAGGHVVVGCGRDAAEIAKLNETFGSHAAVPLFTALDVTDSAGVLAWAERVVKQYGPPDLLINNAAVINRPAPAWTFSADEFARLMNVNVNGVLNSVRAFAPAMIKQKRGVIVNLSSGWGRSTSPGMAPYCASKYAIEGLTLALAQDLPAGMAAIPLNPGVIDTDMLRQCWADEASGFPNPKQWVKRAAPFLLNLSAKDNGQSLSVE